MQVSSPTYSGDAACAGGWAYGFDGCAEDDGGGAVCWAAA
jgi:hypothetical protein